jgi:DsbC/DsbD-like thiol-disulfide interchange protein
MTRRVFALLVMTVSAAGTLLAQGKGSESVVKAAASLKKDGNASVLVISLAIEKGWHIYANPPGNDDLKPVATAVVLQGGAKGEVAYPAGKQVVDPVVGNYRVYENGEEIRVKLAEAPKGPLKVQVSFQACNEKSCLQPAKVMLEAK